MEIDASDTVAAETIEGLKRQPAADAPSERPEADEADEASEATDDGPGLGVDPGEFDEAIGKLWVVGWGALARALDTPELKEERELVGEAADALGPVARKHIPSQLQQHGPEAVALAWITGRIFSKMEHLQ